MKPLLSVLLFFLNTYNALAQWQPMDPALKRLESWPKPVKITQSLQLPRQFQLDIPAPHAHHTAAIIKTPRGIFAGVNGTGYLYKMERRGDSCQWVRVDQTFYTGYNQNAYYFSAGNRIYNFGGAGLFNLTGHLRFFNEQISEWGIVPLNREVLFEYEQHNNIWQDPLNQHILLTAQNKKIASLRLPDPRVERDAGNVLELDPTTGTWTEIGVGKDTVYDVIANAPWGILANNNLSIWLIDYRNNRYYQATEETNRKLFAYFSTKEKAIRFFCDSTLYFGNLNGYFDSLSLSLNDFKDSGIPVYNFSERKDGAPDALNIVIIVLSLIALVSAVLFWRKRKRIQINASKDPEVTMPSPTPELSDLTAEADSQSSPNRTILFKPKKDYTLLDERERSLVVFLLEQSQNGEMVTIDQLNKLLGVSMKNSDVQKRSRSDMINSTNQKLALILEEPRPAIIKQRSEFDKRSFEYTIEPDLTNKIMGILK